MELIRFKNHVPEVYVSESRDFQIFTRLLDLTQNALKHDIDNIPLILDSDNINDYYIEHLKSKVGFYTSKTLPDDYMRLILSAFPYILKYKGSMLGIVKCVNLFSKINGIETSPKIDITEDYTIKIGINSVKIDTIPLEEMLKYIIPTGYFTEIYFYKDTAIENIASEFKDTLYTYSTTDSNELTSVRDSKTKNDSNEVLVDVQNKTFNTVQLSVVYEPKAPSDNTDEIVEE